MNDAPQAAGRPRRPFLEPPPRVPFFKTKEGRLIGGLGILLLLCSALAARYYFKAKAAVERTAIEEREKAEAAAAPTVVALEERIAQKQVELTSIYEGAFADSANGDPFIETGGYGKLLELMAAMTPEATTAKAVKYLDYATASERTDLVRGEFVRVRGLIGGIFAVKLERPVHEITDVWRGTIGQPNGDETVVFDFVGRPPEFEAQSSVVEVDGLMYRTVSYESRTHEQRVSPYMIARNIRLIQADSPTGASSRFWAVLMGIGAIIGYLVLRSSWRAHKQQIGRPTRLKAMFQERQRAQREQQL